MTNKKDNNNSNREHLVLLASLFLGYDILGNYFINYIESGSLSNNLLFWTFIIFSLSLRIIPFWVAMKTSKKLNREPNTWGLVCFIVPFIGLVILSKVKPLKANHRL